MKKTLAFLVALLLAVSCAFADGTDFSEMTDKEILDVVNAGRNALVLSQATDDEIVVETECGVSFIFSGVEDARGDIVLHLVIINDMDVECMIYRTKVFLNGWEGAPKIAFNLDAHRRTMTDWRLSMGQAPLSGTAELEDVELYIEIRSADGRTTIQKMDPVILSFKQE